MSIIKRINSGCSLINVMLYPTIIVYSWILPINTFLRFLLTIMGLFYIYVGIYDIQNTEYKIKPIKETLIK